MFFTFILANALVPNLDQTKEKDHEHEQEDKLINWSYAKSIFFIAPTFPV